MTRYQTRLRTPQSPEQTFAYMADLRNFAQWDPGVRRVTQVDGEGGAAGAVFDVPLNTKRENTLRYHTAVFDPPRTVVVIAKTPVLTSEDRITVVADLTGTIVTYNAELRLNGRSASATRSWELPSNESLTAPPPAYGKRLTPSRADDRSISGRATNPAVRTRVA